MVSFIGEGKMTAAREQHDDTRENFADNQAANWSLSVALPLISTEGSPGGFQVNEVASVAAAVALDFLSYRKAEGLRMVLVAEEGTPALDALRREHASSAGEERRLVVKACALPDVAQAGAPCKYIVNPCNWLLVGRGRRVNVLVNKAAGPCLEKASLVGRKRARVAEPIAVTLPPDSPLRAEGGVETVIQVLGPNIDPRYPDCLESQPDEARRLLRLAYDEALKCFWNLASTTMDAGTVVENGVGNISRTVDGNVPETAGIPKGLERATAEVSSGSKRPADGSPVRTQGGPAGRQSPSDMKMKIFPRYREGPPVPVATSGVGGGHWKTVLFRYLQKPRSSSLQEEVFYEDESCVVVYDGYPKAKYHLLVLPKLEPIEKSLSDARRPSQLRREHLPELKVLHKLATSVAETLSGNGAGFVRCGYHAIPSLEPLHIHVISQDFDSSCLKKKSHWNSFTTGFFLECSWVEQRLLDRGSLDLDISRYFQIDRPDNEEAVNRVLVVSNVDRCFRRVATARVKINRTLGMAVSLMPD